MAVVKKINPNNWEDFDEYADADFIFEKLTHKTKEMKQDKKASIQKKRKDKMKQREEEERFAYLNIEDTSETEIDEN